MRPTHSPTAFIHDMGIAYRALGRTAPIMDALAFHPYEDNSSVSPVGGTHPSSTTIAIADYDKLVGLLGAAFAGTAQPGSTLPIVYDEFGVETQVPAAHAAAYTGTEPATVKPVDETTQAAYYRQAIRLAFCQPNVQGLFLFHSVDENDLDRWQSGLYHADGTAKQSLAPTRAALSEARRGVVAQCEGMRLRPAAQLTGGPRATLRCDIDCSYTAQLVRLPATIVRSSFGLAAGGRARTIAFAYQAPGRYEIRISLYAGANPARLPVLRRSPPFTIS